MCMNRNSCRDEIEQIPSDFGQYFLKFHCNPYKSLRLAIKTYLKIGWDKAEIRVILYPRLLLAPISP